MHGGLESRKKCGSWMSQGGRRKKVCQSLVSSLKIRDYRSAKLSKESQKRTPGYSREVKFGRRPRKKNHGRPAHANEKVTLAWASLSGNGTSRVQTEQVERTRKPSIQREKSREGKTGELEPEI